MNKKLIAVAISATLAAPLAAQAAEMEKSVTLYGRINNALDFSDFEGGDSTTDISNISSRFGIKASADIGNGLAATARYEFSTVTDKELNNINDLRIGTVGLTGAFGSITAGNQWSAFYDTVGTHLDPTYTLGYYLYSSAAAGPYRSSNTVKYANSFGPVNLELDVRLNGSNEASDVAEKISGDGVGIGVSIDATENILFALAFDTEDRDDGSVDADRTGAAIKGNFGGFWGSLSYQNYDDSISGADVDHVQLWLGGAIGEKTSWNLGYGEVDQDTNEPTAVNAGIYHKLGGGLRLYYEGVAVDGDNVGDLDRHLLGMRIDF